MLWNFNRRILFNITTDFSCSFFGNKTTKTSYVNVFSVT